MNARIRHVFDGAALAFATVIAMLTWWQLVEAGVLRDMSTNRQRAYYEQRVQRGVIRSADGRAIATTHASQTAEGDTVFPRRYPFGPLFAHAIGYSTIGKSRTGVERAWNDALSGAGGELANVLDRLRGSQHVRGDDLTVTLDSQAQRVAMEALGDDRGAVVALDPRTGAVRVLASSPSFDPATIEGAGYDEIRRRPDAPLLDRATQARYAPGSTFKLVTASAALESGSFTPGSRFPGRCELRASGPPIRNFGGACVGAHDFTYALTHSVNTTFADIGQQLGATSLLEQMSRYGFGSRPPLEDIPSSELRSSGVQLEDALLPTSSPRADNVDVARVAIGQERLAVSPLQMAMVVATIAGRGVIPTPYLVERVRGEGGKPIAVRRHARRRRAISAKTADELTDMMRDVVREGTGTSAALEGVDVAGKTGTADTPTGNQVWFVGFAPADRPKIAVVVTLERQPPGSTGGVVAGPIARDVMRTLLRDTKDSAGSGTRPTANAE